MSGMLKVLIISNVLYLMSVNSIPTGLISSLNDTKASKSSKYVEINLPVKITTLNELINWVKNAMETMASRIDITLASTNDTASSGNLDVRYKPRKKVERPLNNDVLAPLLNFEAFLPLIVGEKQPTSDLTKYKYGNGGKESTKRGQIIEVDVEMIPDKFKLMNKSQNGGRIPFTIPFEAFITISDDSSDKNNNVEEVVPTRDPPDDFPPYFHRNPPKKSKSKVKNDDNPHRDKKESSKRQQISVLGDLLKALGFTKKNPKFQEAASDMVKSFRKYQSKHQEKNKLDDGHQKSKNGTFLRQEFDEDEDDVKEDQSEEGADDEDDEEEGGSLGSIADLLPLALPILEDLSDPESDTDLIELLQAGIPIIQGLSEGDDDDDEGGGVNALIEMIVPILKKILGGKDGNGIDLSAVIGPTFELLAPFIGPVLAPLIGPLLRTISNPPTEGSSLPVLINAVAGPLLQAQQPSGMSPLAILLAGTTAELLKELKLGQPGGSDIGAFVSAITTGVLAGTSAGLSGPLSGSSDGQSHHPDPGYGYGPYPANSQSYVNAQPPGASSGYVSFPGRPSTPRPFNQPFNSVRPNAASSSNVGSSIRPTSGSYSRPPNYYQDYQRPNHQGPVSAAAQNGGSTYLPAGGNAVPANSVNPISLIGTAVTDVIGAGGTILSSVINAVFGIVGASSSSDDKSSQPTYGPPSHYNQQFNG